MAILPNFELSRFKFSMKKQSLSVTLLLALSQFLLAGNTGHIYHFDHPKVIQVGGFQILSFANAQPSALRGEPMIPYCEVKLLLPPGEKANKIQVDFSDKVLLPGRYTLYPQQGVLPVGNTPSAELYFDQKTYSANTVFPAKKEGTQLTSYFRGRSVALSTFTPVEYNPATGEIFYYKTAKVSISSSPDAEAAQALAMLSPAGTLMDRFDNPEGNAMYSSPKKSLSADYEVLIICTAAFQNNFAGYIADCLKQGLIAKTALVENIALTSPGGDTPEKIRNFIKQEFTSHHIAYVLLAGDDELIPHRGLYCYVQSGSGYTDNNIPADIYYSSLDGNWNNDGDSQWGEPGEDDLLPDVAVARMPFSNLTELTAMLNKTHKYQFSPVAGEFRKMRLAGEYLYSNPDTYGSDYINLLMGPRSDNGYFTQGIPMDYIYDSLYDEHFNWSGQDLINHLNQGGSSLFHCGHANETYVMRLSNPDITNANFSQLDGVTHNYPLVYTHGCLCGAFDYNDCIAEKMVGINNFALAFVGNSRYGWFNEGQTEGPSAHINREFVDALYGDSLNRLGRAHMESKIASAAWVTAPGQWEPGALRWCMYDCNVLGDPAAALYTDNPLTINTTYPSSLLVGATAMNVSVFSSGNALPGMQCVLILNDSIIGKSTTDALGNASINFQSPSSPCTATLYVSGLNCTPTAYPLTFVPTSGPYVVYAYSVVNDPSGNHNNQADYGEFINLTNAMRNPGGTDASNVMVHLQSSDTNVILIDTTELYPFIAAGDTLNIANAFSFGLSNSIPDQHLVQFNLKAESAGITWNSGFSLVCHAPMLTSGALGLNDDNGGNGNGHIEPGETFLLTLHAMNDGSSDCTSALASLSVLSPWASVVGNPALNIGPLAAGSGTDVTFTIQISSQAPKGTLIAFTFHLQSGLYNHYRNITIPIGLNVEDFETGNLLRFPWLTGQVNPWIVNTYSPWEGLYGSRSAPIGDGQSSEMAIKLYVAHDDTIRFHSVVSSESNFDRLGFYIDNDLQQSWSGCSAWTQYTYPVNAGEHTFRWEYIKNDSLAGGDDCAKVDFVILPEYLDFTDIKPETSTPQELSVSPNPTKGDAVVQVAAQGQMLHSLKLYSLQGKLICSWPFELGRSDSDKITIDCSKIATGKYLLVAQFDSRSVAQPLIILH